MTSNPLYNTNNSPNNATQPSKAVNRQTINIKRTHNTFDMSYFHFKTQKFGQYEPFFVMDCTEGDMIPFSSSHDVRSLPFATPFLSSLTLNKDYFMVPHQAIQPNTWDYIYKHPVQGDDVPNDAVNCMDPKIFDQLATNISSIANNIETKTQAVNFLWTLLTAELFFSSGSLLFNLGYKINPQFLTADFSDEPFSFDSYFDSYIRDWLRFYSYTYNGVTYYIDDYDIPSENSVKVDSYVLLNLIRRYGSEGVIDYQSEDELPNDRFSCKISYIGFAYDGDEHLLINLDRVIAYQLCCSQYYVNPQIDFIYNAQLYRDNFISVIKSLDNSFTIDFFTYNGIQIPYDYFSKHYYDKIFPLGILNNKFDARYDVYNYIFGYREQLRFGDYFIDCRTQPLAIGDNDITVSDDNTVSVIDLNESLILQRFRNAVVKTLNTIDDYLSKIFGTQAAPDYHFPKFIIHDESVVKSFEVSSTQGSSDSFGQIVTNLKSEESNKQFEISVDMSCILIGISHFTVPRVYCQTKDKFFFKTNRFDYFNPMLQYLGDQPVNGYELSERNKGGIFGYQSRNGEYKQTYSVASGAFVEKLPAWSFVSDAIFPTHANFVDLPLDDVQSPDFIRSHDFEFNRFFKQMVGYSLANSFHFIVSYNNKCVCNRPMEVNPNTL